MMRMRTLAIGMTFFIVGCGVVVDAPTNRPGVCEREYLAVGTPKDAAGAVSAVIDFFGEETGHERVEVTVRWVGELIRDPAYEDAAFGVFCGCDDLVVYIPSPDYPLNRSSLAHETAHCMGGDAEHNDPLWWSPFGLVNRARERLGALGY